jgi:hypothetical protein
MSELSGLAIGSNAKLYAWGDKVAGGLSGRACTGQYNAPTEAPTCVITPHAARLAARGANDALSARLDGN